MVPMTLLERCEKSRPLTGIRSPDRPASSESLYRLSYPGPQFIFRIFRVCFTATSATRDVFKQSYLILLAVPKSSYKTQVSVSNELVRILVVIRRFGIGSVATEMLLKIT